MPNLFYYHKTSLVHIFLRRGFGMNEKFENLHAKVQYGAGFEYMASANVGLNCMENTILILIILIISKRSAR
jgi:hypothetical protein